jgi:putative hydrolase of the HAD superfamily
MIWVLCDYGEVLSLPQPPSDRLALEDEAGRFGPEFWSAYWQHRPGYDRADTEASDYWTAVLGLRPARKKLERLIEIDVAGWLHPNPASMAAAARAAGRGLRLAILSNAPHEVADAIDGTSWAAAFSPRLFSCRLRAIKPDQDVFLAALKALDVAPSEVTFLDDRVDNVAAARQAGMEAHLFTDPTQIDAIAAVSAEAIAPKATHGDS